VVVDSRAKGARTETTVRDLLRKHTGLTWERVPGSGALDPKHKLKGDLYVPDCPNHYCVEVKGYADDHISSQLLTSKSPQLIDFWKQSVRQGQQVGRKPLLIFKFDRSKIFVAFAEMPTTNSYRYIYCSVQEHEFYVALLEDWLRYEQPIFVS
jgi:Holliday junction resolvase